MSRYVFSNKKYLKSFSIKANDLDLNEKEWIDECIGIVFEAGEVFKIEHDYVLSNGYHINPSWCTKLGKRNYPKSF